MRKSKRETRFKKKESGFDNLKEDNGEPKNYEENIESLR